jgi:hypothetical protein
MQFPPVNTRVLPVDNKWKPPDAIDHNQSLPLIGGLMACYLAHAGDSVDKLFINRLYNCLILCNSSLIGVNVPDDVLLNHSYLLSVQKNMIKSTVDIRLFDRAGLLLKYIPLVHKMLSLASWSWMVTPIIPCLICFYYTDKRRKYVNRGAPMVDPSLAPHNPNMCKLYADCVYYKGDSTDFNHVRTALKN